MTGEVIRLPSGQLLYRARIDWHDVGVTATIDAKIEPDEDFLGRLREHLDKLYPLLVDQSAVLLQFGPSDNIHPTASPAVPAL